MHWVTVLDCTIVFIILAFERKDWSWLFDYPFGSSSFCYIFVDRGRTHGHTKWASFFRQAQYQNNCLTLPLLSSFIQCRLQAPFIYFIHFSWHFRARIVWHNRNQLDKRTNSNNVGDFMVFFFGMCRLYVWCGDLWASALGNCLENAHHICKHAERSQ